MLVMQEPWRNDIMSMSHSNPGGGHTAIKRTFERIRSQAYRLRFTDSVKKFCEQCIECQMKKKSKRSSKAHMKTYISGAPNERVQIDILRPLIKPYRSNKYIIVLTEFFTKWASTYAVPRATAPAVFNAVIDCIGQFGVMKILHSDQGRPVESAIIQKICQRFNIYKTRTTSLNPASDGQVERFNRTLKAMISKYVRQSQRSWDDHLPFVLLVYQSSVHDSTSLSPAMMTYQRELDLPADLIYGIPQSVSVQAVEAPAYVAKI